MWLVAGGRKGRTYVVDSLRSRLFSTDTSLDRAAFGIWSANGECRGLFAQSRPHKLDRAGTRTAIRSYRLCSTIATHQAGARRMLSLLPRFSSAIRDVSEKFEEGRQLQQNTGEGRVQHDTVSRSRLKHSSTLPWNLPATQGGPHACLWEDRACLPGQ